MNNEENNNLKDIYKYISTVVNWTIFVLLSIIGVLLIYYYISVRLYATYGEKFEPKFSVYTIVSPSMEPTISVYDVIINTKINSIEDVKTNDVITFISTWEVTNGMTITHRVVGSKKLDDGTVCLITRGDNNTNEDQSCVKEGNIIGVTKAVIPGLGKLQFFLTKQMGWLLVIILFAVYIIFKDVIKIFRLSKDIKEEEKNKDLEKAYEDLKKIKSKDNKKK